MGLTLYGVMPKKEICVAGKPAERKTAAVPSGAVNERDPPGLPKPRWVFFCADGSVFSTGEHWSAVADCCSALSKRQRRIEGAFARGILRGEALPSIRWFVTMQAPGTVARSVRLIVVYQHFQTGSSHDDAINRRSFTPVRL